MKAPRLSYKDDRARRLADMERLGEDLRRIREIVRQDKLASHNGTRFGNLLADMMLEGYLQDALNAKPKVAA